MIRIYIESRRFREIAGLIEQSSFNIRCCIDLSVSRYAAENGMLHTEHPQMDEYILSRDLQQIADIFSDFGDILAY